MKRQRAVPSALIHSVGTMRWPSPSQVQASRQAGINSTSWSSQLAKQNRRSLKCTQVSPCSKNTSPLASLPITGSISICRPDANMQPTNQPTNQPNKAPDDGRQSDGSEAGMGVWLGTRAATWYRKEERGKYLGRQAICWAFCCAYMYACIAILSRIGHGRWVHGLSCRAKCDGQGSNFNRRQTADCTKGTWDGNDGRPCVSAVHVCMRVAGASQAKAGVGAWLRGCVVVSKRGGRGKWKIKKHGRRRGEALGAPKRADVCAASRGRTGATMSKKRAYGRERGIIAIIRWRTWC
ncbi:hypothetical protein IWZ03DRAFT_47097 [Phyllosticta citriasiana]|uniref:Uncharacterized protein n=1 Tax=Phyllosticta citriasiana TaxID=595635 RepID=A0ABR1KGX4_9PEZI